MSHFTKVATEIKDLEALNNALKSMNLDMKHNIPCRYYYGSEIKENVVKLPGPYDLSIERGLNGSYDLNADFYNGHVEKTIGKDGSILLRNYSVEKLRKEAKKIGCKVYNKGHNQYKVINPLKASEKLEVEFQQDGTAIFKASGFKGQKCMKFADLEKAMGAVQEVKRTSEYYEEQTNKAQVKEWV